MPASLSCVNALRSRRLLVAARVVETGGIAAGLLEQIHDRGRFVSAHHDEAHSAGLRWRREPRITVKILRFAREHALL
jgi:hypothetical protein